MISYVANNNYDQQYFERLANFLESFMNKSHSDWLLKWVPTFTAVLVKKASQTPRISKLYSERIERGESPQELKHQPIAFQAQMDVPVNCRPKQL